MNDRQLLELDPGADALVDLREQDTTAALELVRGIAWALDHELLATANNRFRDLRALLKRAELEY